MHSSSTSKFAHHQLTAVLSLRYGGHYAPVFNEYIVEQNAAIDAGKLPGAHKIDLEAVLIGNGWYDPLLQYGSYYNYTVDNTYDVRFKRQWQYDEMFNAMYGEGNCGCFAYDADR